MHVSVLSANGLLEFGHTSWPSKAVAASIVQRTHMFPSQLGLFCGSVLNAS